MSYYFKNDASINKLIRIVYVTLSILFINFIFNRSFYIDESALALNVINKSFVELSHPLDYYQSAPLFFLWIAKAFSYLSLSDWSLRIFPTICSFLSVIICFKGCRDIVGESNAQSKSVIPIATLSLLFLLCNSCFYRYGTEFKQYAVELCITLLVSILAWKRSYISGVVLLMLAIFLSNIGIVLFLTLCLLALADKKQPKYYLKMGLVTCIYGMLYYFYLSIIYFDNPVREYMHSFWSYAFIPQNIFSKDFYLWFLQRGLSINYELFYYNIFHIDAVKYLFIPLSVMISILQLLGVYMLISKRYYRLLLALTVPIILHLLLSYAHLYPTDTRLVFYLLLNLIVLVAVALYYLDKKLLTYGVLVTSGISFLLNFPIKVELVKPLLRYAKLHLASNEKLYLFRDIKITADYYFQTDKRSQLESEKVIYGLYNINHDYRFSSDSTALSKQNGMMIFGNVNNLKSRSSPLDIDRGILLGANSKATDKTRFISRLDKLYIKKISAKKEASLYKFKHHE